MLSPNTNHVIENEPDTLSDAFEQDAARRGQEMQDCWGSEWPEFKAWNPTRTSSFKGLDRTKIPANADYLVNDPIGLEVFLRLARNRTPSHPMSAVGLRPGPAFMSYGSAVAKYGAPEAPCEDWDEDVDRLHTTPEVSTPTLPKLSWALFGENSFLEYTALIVAQYAKLVREKSS
jgi:hypothetical protein